MIAVWKLSSSLGLTAVTNGPLGGGIWNLVSYRS